MKIFYKLFKSKVSLYLALETICPSLDIKEMVAFTKKGSPSKYYIFTKEGKKFVCPNTKHFLATLNHLDKTEFKVSKCFNRGPNLIHIFTGTDIFDTQTTKIEVKTPEVKVVEEIKEVELTTPEVEQEDLITKRITHAKSLYNKDDKSGSKLALEKFGRTFDIELNRREKFNVMITSLEVALKEKG